MGTLFYLNSEENYRDRKNFTVVLPREVLSDAGANVDALRKRYLNRRVRVVGTVLRYRSQSQIMVEDLAQVRLARDP